MLKFVAQGRGCSAVVARSLCMWKAPGSIPGISNVENFLKTIILGACFPCPLFIFFLLFLVQNMKRHALDSKSQWMKNSFISNLSWYPLAFDKCLWRRFFFWSEALGMNPAKQGRPTCISFDQFEPIWTSLNWFENLLFCVISLLSAEFPK